MFSLFNKEKNKLTHITDLVKDGNTETESNSIILPDPLFLKVELVWELS